MTSLRERMTSFVDSQKRKYPDLAERYAELRSLEERKLWHELTQKLRAFVKDKACDRGKNLIELYENFVKYFSHRMNQLHFVEIVIASARQYYIRTSNKDVEKAIILLEDISGCDISVEKQSEDDDGAKKSATKEKKKVAGDVEKKEEEEAAPSPEERKRELKMQKRRKLGESAFVIIQSHVAWLRLTQNKADQCLALFSKTKPILDAIDCAPPVAHRAYFSVAAEYYYEKGPADEYYRNRLQYVVYTPVEELTEDLRVNYAQHLCLAALVSDKIYNFGEVVALPIFQSLKQNKNLSWLSGLLECFNHGDIERFNNIFADCQEQIQNMPSLRTNVNKLKQKITIICLIELIFQRPASQRNIRFVEIAKATQLKLDQVEWVLMRAMSLGLVRGSIDEVTQTVSISYIQPRVLDKPQLKGLRARLDEWRASVETAASFMEENTAELFE